MSHTKANILVVDDDDGGRYLKTRVLRKHGFNVTEAATGMAAIEQCCAGAPDLVLLDVMLPDVNGIEVSRRIKATHPGIAVLQTSAAVTGSHDRAAALDGGADGFLVEPIERDLGVTDAEMGLLTGPIFVIFYTFLGVPIGRVADSRSRPMIIAIAMAIWSAFTQV